MAISSLAGTRKRQGLAVDGKVRKQTGAQLGLTEDKNGPVKQGANLSTTSPDQIASSDNDLVDLGFAVGMQVSLQGLGKADGVYRVTAAAAGALTVIPAIVSTVSGNAKGILRVV